MPEPFPFLNFQETHAQWEDELFNEVMLQSWRHSRYLQQGIDRDVNNLEDKLTQIKGKRPSATTDSQMAEVHEELAELEKAQAAKHQDAARRHDERQRIAEQQRQAFADWRMTDDGRHFVEWVDMVCQRCAMIFEYTRFWEQMYHDDAVKYLAHVREQEAAELAAQRSQTKGIKGFFGKKKQPVEPVSAVASADDRERIFGYDPEAPGSFPPGPWTVETHEFFAEIISIMMNGFRDHPSPHSLVEVQMPRVMEDTDVPYEPMRRYLPAVRELVANEKYSG